MKEREPIHPKNRDMCETMELFCQHFPSSQQAPFPENKTQQLGKKEILEKYPLMIKGVYMNKLLGSSDTSYYNPGAKRS
jgi:hypothetical protein